MVPIYSDIYSSIYSSIFTPYSNISDVLGSDLVTLGEMCSEQKSVVSHVRIENEPPPRVTFTVLKQKTFKTHAKQKRHAHIMM